MKGDEIRQARRSMPVYIAALPFKIDGEPCRLILLTLGYYAIVDADEYENLWMYNWYATVKDNGVYAVRNKPRRRIDKHVSIYMHRQIMHTPDDEQCDHRFHNTLDCRRSQMRNCPKINNTRNVLMHCDNQSGYKGVVFHKTKKARPYNAKIMVDGESKNLGWFAHAIDAARAYDDEAINVHGEFARLNFPREQGERNAA